MTNKIKTLWRACLCCVILGTPAAADDPTPDDSDSSEIHWSFRPLPAMQHFTGSLESRRTDAVQQPIDLSVSYTHLTLPTTPYV